MKAVNAGARLDRLPIARFHYRTIGLIGGGMFLDAFEIYLQGSVLAVLLASGWSTPAQNALFVSATFAGMVLGAWLSGILGDRFGRRFSYQTNLAIFGLASLAAAAAPSMEWLTMSRFAMGIGLGAEIVVGYVTITELVPPASRGKWGAALATITNSAVFVSAFAARLVIPDFGWRPLFVFVGIGALVVWAARKSLPESPRWLESKGRYGEAEAVLCRIEQEVERTTGAPLPAPVERPQAAPARALRLSHLFSRALLLRTITGCLLLIGVNCTLYGFIAFLPSFMVQQGLTVTTSLNYITLMSLGGPAGALLGLALGDRIGRKACLVLFSLAAIVFGLLYPHAVSPLAITGLGFLLVTASYGLAVIAFSSYIPELFPTELRMRESGLCHTVGRLTLIVTPQIVALLFSIGGVNGVLLFIAGLLAIQVAAILLLGPETKSRSLEALDAGPSLELAGLRAVGLADLPTE